jgi:glycerophosphoryl diester phosphodiesterase
MAFRNFNSVTYLNRSLLIIIGFLSICITGCDSNSKICMPEKGLCAHRGAMGTHPENTIPAFREAVRAGAHMIEFDVQMTVDSQLVVIHDLTVDRTTDGSGRVADLTFNEIRKLDAGSWKSDEFKGERIPTFKEVLNEMPYNVWLNVHLKDGITSGKVARILAQEKRLHQAFIACGSDAAGKAGEVVPGIMICNMDRKKDPADYVMGTINMEADFIQLNGKITSDFSGYAALLKDNGIKVNYFGTDKPEEIKLLFDYGIDFPLVNNISSSINIAKEIGIKPVKPLFKND